MHVDRAADVLKHRDRQATTEVLPEFLESDEKFINRVDGGVPKWDSDFMQALANSPSGILRKSIHKRGIDAVDCDSDRDRFTVTQFEVRSRLEPMSRPMTKVQWSCFEHFKGITSAGDVIQMELAGAVDRVLSHFWHAIVNILRMLGKVFKFFWVLQQGNLNCLTKSAAEVSVWKRFEQL